MPHLDSPADSALLQRIVLRDEGALAVLYDRHARLLYSVALRILRTPAEAEDVLQETFVRVWSRADSFDGTLGSAAAWLTRITRNRSLDRLRSRKAREQVDATLPADLPEQPDETAGQRNPEQLLDATRTAVAVRAALEALPAPQRQLIEAAFFEGFTHHELAVRYGLPLGTVKGRIRTGLLTLRAQLGQPTYD